MTYVLETNENGRVIAYTPTANVMPAAGALVKTEEEVNEIMAGGDAHILDDEIVYPAAAGMTLKNGAWVYPEGYLDEQKKIATAQIKAFATGARRQIVDFADEVKMAEYADKASIADRLASGTASEDEIETAVNDAWAIINNIDDPVVIGQTWQARAHALRTARNAINLLEAQAQSAIDATTAPAELPAVLDGLKTQAESALTQLLAKA